MTPKPVPKEPIAIVGSACHFAGDVDSPSKLWELLRDPRDVRSEIPESRFNVEGFYHPNYAHHGHTNIRHSYLLNEDPAAFDAGFFGINPIETKAIDPQHRKLMETVYEAIESAGLTIEGLRGSDTSVYAGLMCGDYEAMLLRDLDDTPTYFAVGTSRAMLSNRISYFFDWHGASVTLDTACSSSLVAVHMAVQALRAGDSRIAVACGSNIILGPEPYIIESKVKMLSPDGRGRMWDKDANGYARGDGVAAVVLKTLSSALKDGDHVECLIRETGLNQDGATVGITVPSVAAQQALIQSTYLKAGLNLSVPENRPQYFEAHGTGTSAGDPVEAEAIRNAFFGEELATKFEAEDDTLFVGSIKTVLGHTEGTAGIAGILKASLALQNSCIPPNLHFESLSPAVAPFYKNLEICQTARPWPKTRGDQPRRASVNSFGFGGTNVHAILESYDKTTEGTAAESVSLFAPFVFSATSNQSLRASLSAYADFLDAHPDTNMGDLAFTLRKRRSIFPHSVSFSAATVKELQSEMVTRLENEDEDLGVKRIGRMEKSPKILAIFTGQGAQYGRMGADLIEKSPFAQRIIQTLEAALAELPSEDRPSWSLQAEILARFPASRVMEAAISQPLCTAVQIMLVDLLRSANVHIEAVVGHSSGEIAAAYAAGYLTARDAICVAYYRGLHCKNALSPNGNVKGAMLAVGTSIDDAMEICQTEEFAERISVAAINSSNSITISGDEDAIEELQVILEDEKKFNRRLKVDQAYHSKHMLPCFEPYVESLRHAGVKAQIPSTSQCTWFSTVRDGSPVDSTVGLSDVYWGENMTKPVQFSQALTAALSTGAIFDIVLEIGPHPALKGPASQTLQEILQKLTPYGVTLSREDDAIATFSNCLGFLWSHLGGNCIDLEAFEVSMSHETPQHNVLKGLPSYQWSHETVHWHESRRSRRMRLRQQPFHPLLGHESPDSAPHARRWRNVLKASEIPWLEGHQVQGQIVFPAAGFVATALEVAKFLAEGSTIRLIELSNLCIHQAITFDSNNNGIEALIETSQILRIQPDCIVARFTYSAILGDQKMDFKLAADGELRVYLGESSLDLLPKRRGLSTHMIPVNENRLYNFLESLEYNFTSPFRSLTAIRRKLGRATAVVDEASIDVSDSFLVHPVSLDAAFQTVMLAFSYPGDGQLRLLHFPTGIAKVGVNPAVLAARKDMAGRFTVDSTCSRADRATPGSGFSGGANMYTNDFAQSAVQIDQVTFEPIGTAVSEDRNVFYHTTWVLSAPDGALAADSIVVTQYDIDLLRVLSRIAALFLRQFYQDVPHNSPARSLSPLCHYLNYARHMTSLLEQGQHGYAEKEWLKDDIVDVMEEIKAKGVANNFDVRIMLLVGEIMPRVFRGETSMLEHFRESGLLDEYYAHGFGTMQSSIWLSNVVKQITDRHPHLKLLEIGAGTGGATKKILGAIEQSFDTYTFTDISSSFFENAADTLLPWKDRMVFEVYDAERDPVLQGFTEGSYDIIIAYMVIHATAKLDETMRNVRRLLKPGGFLLVGEGGRDGPLQACAGFIFGSLPGWWRGVDEGRNLSPLMNVSEWDTILKCTGFSGIDTVSPARLLDNFGIILFVSQAVDEHINLIRDSLSFSSWANNKRIVIIGGQTTPVAHVAHKLESIFTHLGSQVDVYNTLEQTVDCVFDTKTTIVSLTELDWPIFKDITPERWCSFRRLFESEVTLLWLTNGRLESEPYSNMTVGFGRSAVHEQDGLRLQFLDIPDIGQIDVRTIAEALVRLANCELDGQESLHTFEPEIVIDGGGRRWVPRLNLVSAANQRYNSVQRPAVKQVNMSKSVVELQRNGNGFNVRQLSRRETSKEPVGCETIELRTTHTVLSALKTPLGHKFLALAVDSSGNRYLTLVPFLTSMLKIPVGSAVLYNHPGLSEASLLTIISAHLTSTAIMNPLVAGQKLVCLNASNAITHAITAQASIRGVEVFFMRDSVDSVPFSSSCTKLSPYLSRSELGEIIPHKIDSFVSFSRDITENDFTITSTLSSHCYKETNNTVFSSDAIETEPAHSAILGDILQNALRHIADQDGKYIIKAVNLEQLSSEESIEDPLTVVDWTASTSVLARITRLDIKGLFKESRTYWLCGLSGALGISLCDWMIDRGVRYLVLTSRNPKIDPTWIKAHRSKGVNVEILRCDVTDEKALRETHGKIVESFPPIAGVLNGAMVLRDVSVRNMTFDQLMEVIRPKVHGSMYLDQIFYNVNLDFFILLSSINCVIGNVGQANYAAANMGVCGIAASRRRRGLASSVVNVGAIIGVGYITERAQSERQLDVTAAKAALMYLSEEDFHQIFAETMEAGYVDSAAGPEISTGLLSISAGSANFPKHYSDPMFSHLIAHKTSGCSQTKQRTNARSIEDRLQDCRTNHELLQVIQRECIDLDKIDVFIRPDSETEAFAAHLRKVLQIATNDEDLMSMRGVDLGLDSLISVDLRSWFLKTFQVSIPVLKIMANDVQMASLADSVAEDVPTELVPRMSGYGVALTKEENTSIASTATSPSKLSSDSYTSVVSSPKGAASEEDEVRSHSID